MTTVLGNNTNLLDQYTFGASYNQHALDVTCPAAVGKITTAGVWLKVSSGTVRTRLVIWDKATLAVKGYSAQFNVTATTFTDYRYSVYADGVSTVITTTSGQTLQIGLWRNAADTTLIDCVDTGNGTMYYKTVAGGVGDMTGESSRGEKFASYAYWEVTLITAGPQDFEYAASKYYIGFDTNIYEITPATGIKVADTQWPAEDSVAVNTGGFFFDGTNFKVRDGGDKAGGAKVYTYSNWTWTTASALYWVGSSWYDDVGTAHETAISPRNSITMLKRRYLTVGNAAMPGALGADDPDKVRIYMKPNATDPGAGNFKLQVTDALTSRVLSDYASGGAADGGGTPFAGGTGATLQSTLASTGWIMKGDGTLYVPSAPPTATIAATLKYDTTLKTLGIGDGSNVKPLKVGGQLYAFPEGWAVTGTYTTAKAIAISGSAGNTIRVQISVKSWMWLHNIAFWCTDTTGTHTLEGRLFFQPDFANATYTYLPGSACTWNFTAAAATFQRSTITGGSLIIPPGTYEVVIRNTSASVATNVGTAAAGTLILGYMRTSTTALGALGSTIDMTMASWTGAGNLPCIGLNGATPDNKSTGYA